MNKRFFFSLLASSAVLAVSLSVAGCGGAADSDSRNSANVRLVNITDQTALALFADGTSAIASVSPGSASNYATLDDGSTTLQTRAGGISTSEADHNLAKGRYYSLLAYTTGASTARLLLLDDSETAPAAGSSKLRVVNTAPDVGSVDVYLTSPSQDLATAPTTRGAVGAEQASAFTDLTSGSYRVRVTAADDRSKLLLDLPSVTFSSQQVLTLVLSRSSGGVLVHGLLLAQQGAATAQRNPSMRVRLVAAATGNASVAASIGGTVVSAGLPSPSIGNYVLVPAGVTTANITAGGNTVSAGTLPTTTGGEDLTLLVSGAPTAATAHWLSENNRLPTGTSRAVVRLVHGINNVGQLSMTVDGEPVASGLTLGQSAGASVASGTNQVQITTPGFTLADKDEDYTANGVYTVFVLGDSPTTPSVQERRSR